MKKIFILFFALITSAVSMFASVEIDGIAYNLNTTDKTAEVTSKTEKYSGDVIIPESVTYNDTVYAVTNIGDGAFSKCNDLISINISNRVTSIGNHAFSYCNKLTNISIPNSVTNIGSYAFYDCRNLSSITNSDNLITIGTSAFSFCTSLTSVTIPNSVATIGSSAFYSCGSLTSINVAPDNAYYSSVDGVLFNKNKTTLIQYPGSKQGAYTIPNSVILLISSAFFRCNGLTSIEIPDSFTKITDNAFCGCRNLTSVTIPNSITSIGEDAFAGCSALISVSIPNSVVSIGNRAFSSCSSLTSLDIPSSVTSIGYCLCSGISGLTSINVAPDNSNYCSVDGVLFDKNKTMLIQCPGGKQGVYTFPNSVKDIQMGAFTRCNNLTSIIISDSVTNIGNSAFSYCYSLTSIDIPSSVTNIGSYAFYDCHNLSSIEIPRSVTSINEWAFAGCSNLTSITNNSSSPQKINSNVFTYTNDNRAPNKSIPVYVPAESVEAYRNADQWKEFTNIQAIAGFDPEHPANPGSYQLTLVVEDTNKGYTTGSGLYEQGATAHIEAIARDGYQFVCWSDNDSNAVRDIVIIRDSTLTASFTEALGDDTVYVDFTRDLDDLPIGKNTNVIITPYGRLNITRPIAIKSLMIEKDTAFGQVSGVDMLQAESVEVMHYFYRHIDEGSYRWFAFSVPFTVSVAEGIFMNEAHDVARYGVDFVIDEYDGHLRATTQEGWKRVAANATLYPGKFYMIASKQANIWYFKALDPSTAFDAEPFAPITAYSSAIGDHHAGWNGIANTLFVNANLQAKNIQYATTYNNYYGVYSVMPLTNYMTERPGMPFFVQASEHDTIEFKAQPEPLYTDGGIGDPIPADAPSRLRRAHESRPFVLSIGNSEYTDKAYVDLAADKEDRYTIGEDLIKMQTSKPTVPQIWINAYDAHLAAYAMPAESEKSAIELGISTPQEGTYTLSFDNVPQGMTMFISKDGEHLYPLSNGEYEIYLEKGVNTNYRIDIYRTPAIYTDIENINSSKGHCEKMIKDGKLYLLYEGTMYNVQGVKVIDK